MDDSSQPRDTPADELPNDSSTERLGGAEPATPLPPPAQNTPLPPPAEDARAPHSAYNDYPPQQDYPPQTGYPPRYDGPPPGYAPPRYDGPPPGYMPQAGYAPPVRERRRPSGCVLAAGGCLAVIAVFAVICAAAVGIVGAMTLGGETAQDTVTRSFAVTGTPNLVLNASAADVQIFGDNAGGVRVALTREVRAFSRERAQSELNQITLDAQQSGDTITISEDEPPHDGWWGHWYSRHIRLELHVPPTANLDATMTAGNLDVSGLTGSLSTDMTAGNVVMRGVTLQGTTTERLTAGNLDISGELAPNARLKVDMTAGDATLSLPLATSAHVEASSSAGNVHITGWPSVTNDHATDGTLSTDLNPHPTGTITVTLTAGDVTIEAE